jgi:aspartate racemase
MEEDFYKERLNRKHNIEVIIPEKKERDTIHRILYSELCLGVIKHISRDTFKKIIENLVGKGAEGIILGCTEIPLLVRQEDYEISLFDTTSIHAKAAVEYAIS